MITKEQKLINMFYDNGIVQKGHWLLSSGLHSSSYIKKNLITTIPHIFKEVNKQLHDCVTSIMGFLPTDNICITGPPISGSLFAANLGLTFGLPFIFSEKATITNWQYVSNFLSLINFTYDNCKDVVKQNTDTKIIFQRDFPKIIKNKSVIIIEDIATTGGSIIKTKKAVETCGGTVTDIIIIWNCGCTFNLPDIRIQSLINYEIPAYQPNACHLCTHDIILIDPKTGLEL